jgi:pimeloyl-ACP methyl ester carboxylesterase
MALIVVTRSAASPSTTTQVSVDSAANQGKADRRLPSIAPAAALADTGEGWSAEVPLVTGLRVEPALVVDAEGSWHLLYVQWVGRDTYLRYLSSEGDAATIASASLDPTGAGDLLREPTLAMDAGGSLHAAYVRSVESGWGTITRSIMYTSDTGAGWSAEVPLATGASVGMPALVVDAEGSWHLVYGESATSGDTRLTYIRYLSSEGHAATIASASYDNSTLTGAGVSWPSLAIDASGSLHAAYVRSAFVDSAVVTQSVMYTSDAGAGWSAEVPLVTGASADQPALVVDAEGSWHLLYVQSVGGDTYIRHLSSEGDAVTIASASLNLATGTGDVLTDGTLAMDADGSLHAAYVRRVIVECVAVGESIMYTRQLVPVILVHGWRGGPETWSTLRDRLDAEQIPYYIFDYSPGLGDPKGYAIALRQWVEQLKADTGYTGRFDIVAHSMGAVVSRWYMEELGGAENVRQWIGVAPVNHGAAIASVYPLMATLNKLFFFVPGYLVGSEPAVQAMRIESDTLADLNYGESHFNLAKWKTVPETLAEGVIYRNLAGINDTLRTHGFSPATAGETLVVKKETNGELTRPYWTHQGDGVVPLYLSQLEGVSTDCFEGANHSSPDAGITRDSRVIDRIVLYLQDPSSPSLDNCPTADPDADYEASGTDNRGILRGGVYLPVEFPVDPSVAKATVMLSWQGSEVGLTLTSPSAEEMEPGVYPVVDHWQGGASIWYVIDAPESGMWTAGIEAIDVPAEGEPYTLMTFYVSPIVLEVATDEGFYSFEAGESATVVASLAEDDVPITGASVEAEVRQPDDSIDELVLYDDGSHGDALADDGDYTNAYALPMAGNYDFTVVASGAASEAFERTAWMTLWVEDLTPPVGGIAELPDASGSSGPNYVALAGLAAGALLAVTAGAWYARRRWAR